MAYATKTTQIANILLGGSNQDTFATMVAKINSNNETLASTIDSVYNNLYFNPSTKTIGDQSSISLVNTKKITIDIPSAAKTGNGIDFSLSGVSKGSILTDANGDTTASFNVVNATTLNATTITGASLTVSANACTVANTVTAGSLALTLGSIKTNTFTESTALVPTSGTNDVTLTSISVSQASNQMYAANLAAGITTVNIVIPNQTTTVLDGYEFTVMVKNTGNAINTGIINLSYAGGIINTNTTTYQIGTSFAVNTTKVITFRFIGSKIVVKSVA